MFQGTDAIPEKRPDENVPEQGLNQVDLNRSNRRVTDKEYHANRRGQEKLDQEMRRKKREGSSRDRQSSRRS